jgi:hypothetical protein
VPDVHRILGTRGYPHPPGALTRAHSLSGTPSQQRAGRALLMIMGVGASGKMILSKWIMSSPLVYTSHDPHLTMIIPTP